MGGDGQCLLVWPVSCFVFAFRCQVSRKLDKKKDDLESRTFVVILDVSTVIYLNFFFFLFLGGSIRSALMRLRQRTS